MNLKTSALLTALLFTGALFAKDDTPNGFMPLAKLAEAQAKAKQTKKLIAVVAKGSDDQCPYCVAALAQGTATLKSDCVIVFTRVANLRAQRESLPPALKTASATAADGAAVAFYVFDPEMNTLVTTTDRQRIQADPKSLKETKKIVNEAQKKLAASPAASSAFDALKPR